jgi:flavin reductase (DIM6/NTAB) family NADH-FMN oxidoreductase RutF
MHTVVDLKVLYFGTPVVLIGSRNPDGTSNLAPMSSAWWLGQYCLVGLGNSGQTTANLHRERQCVLNLVPAAMADAVDRIALTTGSAVVPPAKVTRGYRHVADKFAAAGLTERAGELVAAPRVAECPIQLEGEVEAAYPFGGTSVRATAFQIKVVRTHVASNLLIPGTDYIDPLRWDPLVMKFCEFFGGGEYVHPSRLADGWRMPHRRPLARPAAAAGVVTSHPG